MSTVRSKHPPSPPPEPISLYDADGYRWAREQAAAIRERRLEAIDWENVAEEIESVGKSEQREIASRLTVLVVHLLKSRYQPEKRKGGWEATIKIQRLALKKCLRKNPSLADLPRQELVDDYVSHRLEAHVETKLDLAMFPVECPFTLDEILDDDFFG